jgi:cysteine desulfurase / selenocysteine lyase
MVKINMGKKYNINNVKKDFPILDVNVNGKPLVYLDNAATSQKPRQVIDAVTGYYEKYNANIHRSIHKLGEEATSAYENSREKVAKFVNCNYNELIFTKSTTESLNLLAYSLTNGLKSGDEILISEMEHHSNLVPWQQLALKNKLKLKFIEVDKEGLLDENSIIENISKKTKIVSVTHISNVLGTINDVKEISKIAHENDALMVVDGAQSVPHMKMDVKELDADFLAFSGHKMLGPTGVGALFGKEKILQNMSPFLYGGEMIKEVTYKYTKFNDIPWKFEAGTPNIAQVIGLGAAVDYLNKTGMEKIEEYEKELVKYAYETITKIEDVDIIGPGIQNRSGLISFKIKNVHAHDVAQVLDEDGIAVRAGHHCAMPLHSKLGISATTRASFYLYNSMKEIDKLVDGIKKSIRIFK